MKFLKKLVIVDVVSVWVVIYGILWFIFRVWIFCLICGINLIISVMRFLMLILFVSGMGCRRFIIERMLYCGCRYYSLVVLFIGLVIVVVVYFYWFSMKFFKYVWYDLDVSNCKWKIRYIVNIIFVNIFCEMYWFYWIFSYDYDVVVISNFIFFWWDICVWEFGSDIVVWNWLILMFCWLFFFVEYVF